MPADIGLQLKILLLPVPLSLWWGAVLFNETRPALNMVI